LAKKLGCDFEKNEKDRRISKVVGLDRQDATEYDPRVDRILPRGISLHLRLL